MHPLLITLSYQFLNKIQKRNLSMASDPCSLIFRVCGGGQAVLLACVYSEHPLAVTSCGLARLPAASSVPGPANGSAAAGDSSQSQARDFRQGQAVAVSEAPVYLDRGLHDPAQPSPAQPSPGGRCQQ